MDDTLPDRIKELQTENEMLRQTITRLMIELERMEGKVKKPSKKRTKEPDEMVHRYTAPLPGRKRNKLDIE